MNRADTFDRANSSSALGTPSDGGSAWVAQSGTWGITSNLGYSVSGGSQETAVLEANSADVDVQVTLALGGNSEGLVARAADDNNYLLFIFQASTNQLLLYKKVGGSFIEIDGGIVNSAVNVNDVYKLSVSGSTINCYQNGVLKIGPITETAGQTNTKHGIRSHASSGGRFDTFSITDTSAAASVGMVLRRRSSLRSLLTR